MSRREGAMARTGLTIIFSGVVAGASRQGGAAWATLQYVLGFRELGHDVYLVEPVSAHSLEPPGTALGRSSNAAFFQHVVSDFGLQSRAALVLVGTRDTVGLPYDRLQDASRRAGLHVNVAGMLSDPELTEPIPVRVYLDLDPAFTQLWHDVEGVDMGFSGHNRFVTVGQAIGTERCRVPTCGLPWNTTHQPVSLPHWPPAERVVHDAFTTVGNWRSYGPIEHDGVRYGQKVHSLRSLLDLPSRTDQRFLLAMAIDPGDAQDLARLAENGWSVIDPSDVAGTPGAYRRFVQGSKAELGISKSGYVVSRCGWFSDRSVCYLASGRPVVAQDTGFGDALPTGEGLFAFATVDDVVGAVEEIDRNYERHSRAARRIAEEHFAAPVLLTRLLESVGAEP
ncbi:MAG: glycosyltransferase [Acidimicrobiia bacterium]